MNTFEIALSADKNMEVALHVAVVSILRSIDNSRVIPRFNLLLKGFSRGDVDRLKVSLERVGKMYELSVIEPDLSRFEVLRGLHGNYMTYARILLPELIQAPRVFYIDADTLTAADISGLYEQDLNGRAVGVVIDETVQSALESSFYRSLGLPSDGQCFNAGVILMDTEMWRREGLVARCLEFGRKYPDALLSADQVILNYVFHERAHPLDAKYNNKVYPSWRSRQQRADGTVMHFVGSPKPWDLLGEVLHFGADQWTEIAQETAVHRELVLKYFRLRSYARAMRILGGYKRCISAK